MARFITDKSEGKTGGSHSFQVAADDGEKYWCKVLNNPQGEKVPIVEQLVGRLGKILGVDVADVALIRIPPELAGQEYSPGLVLEEGWAHGSRLVSDSIEVKGQLGHRSTGNNPKLQVGLFAIYDWLLGSDPQWMRQVHDDRYISHDNGQYLASGNWGGLAGSIDTPNPLGSDPAGLDRSEINRVADRLQNLSREEIAESVAKLPGDWPVSGSEREAVVDFAYARRTESAARLRALGV